MKIYVVGSSKNKFLPLDNIREKFLIDQPHEGDNIDFLNPWYCELTGLYYLWKHVDDEIVGLEHYRRYFVNDKGNLLSENEISELLKKYDVISHMSKDIGSTVFQATRWCNSNHISMENVAKRILFCLIYNYPAQKDFIINMMNNRCHWQGNMLICRKKVLQKYCEWLFDFFFNKFKDFQPTDIPSRTFGYMSELFLYPFWLHINKMKIKNSCRLDLLKK